MTELTYTTHIKDQKELKKECIKSLQTRVMIREEKINILLPTRLILSAYSFTSPYTSVIVHLLVSFWLWLWLCSVI